MLHFSDVFHHRDHLISPVFMKLARRQIMSRLSESNPSHRHRREGLRAFLAGAGIFTSSYNVVFLIQAIHSTFQLEITNKYCDLFMVDV